jgi:hypothetical protein
LFVGGAVVVIDHAFDGPRRVSFGRAQGLQADEFGRLCAMT